MSTPSALKLLTLLNVSAVDPKNKRRSKLQSTQPTLSSQLPQQLPTLSSSSSTSSAAASAPSTKAQRTPGGLKSAGGGGLKRKKSLIWAEELESGPSGSQHGTPVGKKVRVAAVASGEKKKDEVNGKDESGKGKGKGAQEEEVMLDQGDSDDEDGQTGAGSSSMSTDGFHTHFGPTPDPKIFTSTSIEAAPDSARWKSSKKSKPGLGSIVESLPEGSEGSSVRAKIIDSLMDQFKTLSSSSAASKASSSSMDPLQSSVLSTIGAYQDLYLSRVELEEREKVRDVTLLHAVNHVLKTRRRILKTNEKLAHEAAAESSSKSKSSAPSRSTSSESAPSSLPKAAPSPTDPRDQGFTRPKILILLPFRSTALLWINSLLSLFPPSTQSQTENKSRFLSEFSLPPGVADRLVEKAGEWPKDHVDTFKGNVDDNFRVGVKVTRKSVKLFGGFYGSDIVVGSPLGLRMSIEKEKSADFLSSIEIVVADQLDAMSMQNWEHVQFIFSKLNALPDDAHGCDFSRVKPWYLDGHSKFLRQTILLSAYETPEMRSLYNKSLTNVAGKVRTEGVYDGELLKVKRGVKQVFTRFEALDPNAEPDIRFEQFTTKFLPSILKSAVMSSNTIVVVPSYFDFVRVQSWMRKQSGMSFAAISEYSSNQEISRARTSFFKGSKSLLLITERFHFYRRYRLRGAKTYVFYQLPDHAVFYPELVSFAFLAKGGRPGADAGEEMEVEVDEGEVSTRVMFSKWDWMKLERVVGTEDARKMVAVGAESVFTFV